MGQKNNTRRNSFTENIRSDGLLEQDPRDQGANQQLDREPLEAQGAKSARDRLSQSFGQITSSLPVKEVLSPMTFPKGFLESCQSGTDQSPARNIIFAALTDRLRITENAPKEVCEAYVYSLGAMHITFQFLQEEDKVKWQQLSTWWYNVGVSRLQPIIENHQFHKYKEVVFLAANKRTILVYFVARGQTRQFQLETEGLLESTDRYVQTPANNIYLLTNDYIFQLVFQSQTFPRARARKLKMVHEHYKIPVVCSFRRDNVIVSGQSPWDLKNKEVAQTRCSIFIPSWNSWVGLLSLNQSRSSHSMCQVGPTHVWVFGGITTKGQKMLNSIERSAIRIDASCQQDPWETIQCPKHYLLPTLQNAKMVQVSNEEVCIFGAGYSVSVNFESLDIYNSEHKPGMRVDFWQAPAVCSTKDTIVTADMQQNKILTFKQDKGVVMGCSL